MPNHKRQRRVAFPPKMEGFKPFGIPATELTTVTLLFEELEAIRLIDYEGLMQEDAAAMMNISRPTFTRIYNKAHKTIAKAFIESKAILIRGGNYIADNYWYKCEKCKEVMVALKPLSSCRNCQSHNIVLLNSDIMPTH